MLPKHATKTYHIVIKFYYWYQWIQANKQKCINSLIKKKKKKKEKKKEKRKKENRKEIRLQDVVR